MMCPRCSANVDLETHTDEKCQAISWRSICPPLYRATDVNRLPKEQYEKAMQWKFGSTGVLFLGPSGKGKTRTAYELLKREHMAGRRLTVFDCMSFGHQCAQRFHDGEGEEWIERVAKRDIVFWDDIEKSKFTERVEAELFGVIEKRIANCLPILATTQLAGEAFASKFADGVRGAAIVRRLREFCTAINF